jgi:hypothetical protein
MTARIQTHSGLMVDPLHLSIQDIRLEDIAHALSHLCRFTGHTSRFYSVAEHSVWCSRMVHPKFAAHALLHDASEAYLQDIPSPLKHLPEFAFYRAAETRAQKTIRQALLSWCKPGEDWVTPVKFADDMMLHAEADYLLDAHWADVALVGRAWEVLDRGMCWAPDMAKERFLARAVELGIG